MFKRGDIVEKITSGERFEVKTTNGNRAVLHSREDGREIFISDTPASHFSHYRFTGKRIVRIAS